MNLQEFRAEYPEYNDLGDKQLAEGLHEKYYSDIPFNDFASQIGYLVEGEPGTTSGTTAEFGGPIPVPEEPEPETTGTTAEFGGPIPPPQDAKRRVAEKHFGTDASFKEPPAAATPTGSKVTPADIYDRVLGHEGLRLKKYKDHLGNWTIGIGHKLKPGEELDKIDDATAFQLYEQDMQQAIDGAAKVVSVFPKLDPVRQGVVAEMVYQMGETGVKKFKKMNGALENGDYNTAAAEMLKSKWATQTPKRAQELAETMRTAAPPPPEDYDLEGVGLNVGEYSGSKLSKDFAQTAGQITGSMAGATAGGIAGIADLARTTIEEGKPDLASAAEAIRAVAKEFEVEVDADNEIAKLVNKPFETLEKIARAAGDKVLDLTGSAGLATAVYSTVVMSPILGPGAVRKIGGLKAEIGAAKTAKTKAKGTYEKTIKTTAEQPKLEGRGKPIEGKPPAPAPKPEPAATSPARVEGGKAPPKYPGKPKPPIPAAQLQIMEEIAKNRQAEAAKPKEPKVPEEDIRRGEELGQEIIENRRIYGEKGDDLFTEYLSKGMSAKQARAKVRETLGEPKPAAAPEEPAEEGPQPLRTIKPEPLKVQGKATPTKEYNAAKEGVLAAIEKELKNFDTKADPKSFIRFIDPQTGTEMNVIYTPPSLQAFKKAYSAGVKPPPTPTDYSKIKATPSPKPAAGKKEDWGAGYKQVGEWTTTQHFIVKGKPPKGKKPDKSIDHVDQSIVDGIVGMAEGATDADLRYYATSSDGLEGVSKTPVPGEKAYAVFRDKATDIRHVFDQNMVNVVTNRFPDATFKKASGKGPLFAYDNGEMVAAIMPLDTEIVGGIPAEELAKGAGLYNIGEFAETPVVMEMPELIQLTRELLNSDPELVRTLGEGVRGAFFPRSGKIRMPRKVPLKVVGIDPTGKPITTPDFHQALKTLAHELGHAADWLPDKYMGRGNILGRIASLRNYRKALLPEKPGAPGELTEADRKRLKKEAKELAKAEGEEMIDEVIRKETPVSPDDVLAILKGIEAENDLSPELIHFIFTASTAVKKSIAVQAMKGLSPVELSHLKSVVLEKTGKQIPKGVDPAAIKKKYEELLAKEIKKRKLWNLEEITMELKRHTANWRPYTRGVDLAYDRYRDSSVELYADAVSAILTAPNLLKETAPKFYEAFFNYLETKPEFKENWEVIQERLQGGPPEERTAARVERDYAMFQRGHNIRAAMTERRRRMAESVYSTFARGLWDKKHAVLHELRLLEKRGGRVGKMARNVRYELEETEYIASTVSEFMYQFNKRVQVPMEEAKLTLDDLGIVALRQHIAANRKDIFSTQGYTPETAKADLKHIKKMWGAEKYDKAIELLKADRALREEFVFPILKEGGLLTPELETVIDERTWYQKMSVLKYLEDTYGVESTARIYKQIGSFEEIENPVIARVLQDISLMRASVINHSKASFIKLARPEGIIEPADMKFTGLRREPVPPRNRKEIDILSYMDKGKLKHYYAPAPIVESFRNQPFQAMMVTRFWNVMSAPLRAILVNKNPVWMARNPIRDFRESIQKNPEIGLRHTLRLANMYRKAFGEVFKDVFLGKRSEDIAYMLKHRMLLTERVYTAKDYNFDDEIERLINEFAIDEKADSRSNFAVRAWNKLMRELDKLGRVSEITSKVAGYKYFTNYTNLPMEEIGHRIRGRIGTPDVKRQGSWHPTTNNLFIYSTVGKEGIRSNFEGFREGKGAYIWKTIATKIFPKLIMAAVAAGYAGKKWKDIIDAIPEYDKALYDIIPLYLDDQGKAHYIRIPQDYEGQYFGALFWKLLNMRITGPDGAVSTITNANPYQLHPYLQVGSILADYYLKGQNPVDDYRGQFILSDRTYMLGGSEAAKSLGVYAWKNLGLSVFYNPEYSELEMQRSDTEKMLRSFPGNILGTFYKISDQGKYELAMMALKEDRKTEASKSVEIDKNLAKLSPEEKLLLANIAPQLRTRIRKQALREKNSALSRALAATKSKREIAIVLDIFKDDLLGAGEPGPKK